MRTKIEQKPVFLAGRGAAADSGGSFDNHDRNAAPTQQGGTDQAGETGADHDDWGCVRGHTLITFDSPEPLQRDL
jgi:hypothetical protein